MNKKYLIVIAITAIVALCMLSSCKAKDKSIQNEISQKEYKPYKTKIEKPISIKDANEVKADSSDSPKTDSLWLEPKMNEISASLDSLFVLQQKNLKNVQSLLFWNLIVLAISVFVLLGLLGLSVYRIFFMKSKAVKPVAYSPQNKAKTPKTPWKWD